ncbi:9756_t:CDS:1, partial [Racocetra persica]
MCKESRDRSKIKKLPVITNSTIELVKQPKSPDHDNIQKMDTGNTEYIKVDCLDVTNLIEHELKNLTANAVYQTRLLVNVDLIPDMMTKEVAALVVAKIEGGNDYL